MALVWLWVWSLPFVSFGLRGALEGDYPAQSIASFPQAGAIVVLGGVINPPDTQQMSPNLSAAADRLRIAAQLYHAGKAPLVVLSGGSDLKLHLTSEAEAMRVFMGELGVANGVMLLEESSRNTSENARFTSSLLRKRGIEPVLLVTSALHMQRALRHFEDEGIQVIPVATDHEARAVSGWKQWLPDADALDGSARALKEWVGQRLQAAS